MKIRFSFQKILVNLTVLYCLLFPADIINVKEILFLVTVLVCISPIVNEFFVEKNFFLVFYSLIYPSVTIVYSFIFTTSTVSDAISFGYVWLYILLIPIVNYYKIDFSKTFLIGTTIIIFITDFIFISDFFGIVSIFSNPLVLFLNSIKELQYGKGLYSTFGYSIFLKAIPLAFFSYGYLLKEKKYVLVLFYLMAFFVSGTRANLLVALVITFAVPLFEKGCSYRRFIYVGILILCIIFIFPSFIDYYIQRSALKRNSSDMIKINHALSIIKYMNENKARYIFGSGIGSYFYSTGRSSFVNVVEVSFLDYFRQVGVIAYSFFIAFIIKPFLKYKTYERWILIAYMGYLAIAFTNPLLVSSTAFMGYVLLYTYGFNSKYSPNKYHGEKGMLP